MYCNKCGSRLSNDAKFCSACGNVTERNGNEENHCDYNQEEQVFSFRRHKSLGKLDISHAISEISIIGDRFKLKQQKIRLYFWKKTPIVTEHNIRDFAEIKISRTLDLSDTIFTIIFFFMGFINPPFFILSLLMLWISIGYNITILKNNGVKLVIPTENHSMGLELVKHISLINNSIGVEQ